LQYGLSFWGNSTQKALKELTVRQNKVIRIITSSVLLDRNITPIYKRLNLLKLNKMHNFELAKFMYKFYNKQFAKWCDEFSYKLAILYTMRYSKNVMYVLPKFSKILAQNYISFKDLKL